MNKRFTYIHLCWATAICLVVVFSGNIVMHYMFSVDTIPSSYEAYRNPYFRRAWPEWTRSVDPLPGDQRVIIISNSQGFLRERSEAEFTYSAILERRLNDAPGQDWEVLNWSVPGINAPEMVVLGARAAVHRPDIIFLVAYTSNFVRDANRKPLSFSISDVPLLTAIPSTQLLLSRKFQQRFETGGFDRMLQHYTGYGKLRWRTPLEERGGETWRWRVYEPDVKFAAFNASVAPWNATASWMVQEFVETSHRAAPDAKICIISMPVAASAWTEEAWQELFAFRDRVFQAVGDKSYVSVLNAIDVVPEEMFYLQTHMRPEGHEVFAEFLYTAIISSQM